jgi:hypothetical protein
MLGLELIIRLLLRFLNFTCFFFLCFNLGFLSVPSGLICADCGSEKTGISRSVILETRMESGVCECRGVVRFEGRFEHYAVCTVLSERIGYNRHGKSYFLGVSSFDYFFSNRVIYVLNPSTSGAGNLILDPYLS